MEQLRVILAGAGINAVGWGEKNHVAFNNSKDGMIAFTWQGKGDLKKRLVEARIMVRGHIMGFNVEPTR